MNCHPYSQHIPSRSLAEHYADDLEVDIDEIMSNDFNVELEDDSPRMVMP
jgi:hypothetical protein